MLLSSCPYSLTREHWSQILLWTQRTWFLCFLNGFLCICTLLGPCEPVSLLLLPPSESLTLQMDSLPRVATSNPHASLILYTGYLPVFTLRFLCACLRCFFLPVPEPSPGGKTLSRYVCERGQVQIYLFSVWKMCFSTRLIILHCHHGAKCQL